MHHRWNKYRTKQFFKITNEAEQHHDHKYVDGLNILQGAFIKKGSCVAGGFYFTTLEHIAKFYELGVNLREITLPFDDKDFCMVLDPMQDKWRANRIILGKKYSLLEPDVYDVHNLEITFELLKKLVFANKYDTLDRVLAPFSQDRLFRLFAEHAQDTPTIKLLHKYFNARCKDTISQVFRTACVKRNYAVAASIINTMEYDNTTGTPRFVFDELHDGLDVLADRCDRKIF